MRYTPKHTEFVEAEQWFKNGDHSEDQCEVLNHGTPEEYLSEGKLVRRFNHPDPQYFGDETCQYCGQRFHTHGFIDRSFGVWFNKKINMVCPGDYIIKYGKEYQIRSAKEFEEKWEQWPALSPIEALNGFMAWLTCRQRAVTFSSAHNAAGAGQLVSRFANVQKLGNCREGVWPDNLVPMADHDIPVGHLPSGGALTPFAIQVSKLLQTAATLVGNSKGNEDLCDLFQKDLRQFAKENALRIVTYSSAKTGEELVKEERRRQIEEEGFTPEHDNKYQNFELEAAARSYFDAAVLGTTSLGNAWPWSPLWWKPTTKLANLIKSGALWQAEIDRVKRTFGGYRQGTIAGLEANLKSVILQIDEELKTQQKDK